MDVARLKAEVPPAEFYRTEIPSMPAPKREHGWTPGGLCPFHDDRHPRNFRVNLDTGAFRCFSCGTKGADVIAFTQTRHGLSFVDALKVLADTWGIHI